MLEFMNKLYEGNLSFMRLPKGGKFISLTKSILFVDTLFASYEKSFSKINY